MKTPSVKRKRYIRFTPACQTQINNFKISGWSSPGTWPARRGSRASGALEEALLLPVEGEVTPPQS
jgi:hypothetical protein